MKKISIKNTYFKSWAILVAIFLGITVECSSIPDIMLTFLPYNNWLWYFAVKLPMLLILIILGYLLFSLVLFFIEEKITLAEKVVISSLVAIPMLMFLWLGSRECTLVLDNVGTETAHVLIKELDENISIEPYAYQKITIPKANLTIIGGVNDTLEFCPKKGMYLYNYKMLGGYKVEDVFYSSKISQYSGFNHREPQVHSVHWDHVFPFEADFIFEVPNEIEVHSNNPSTYDYSPRKALLRMIK
jgi:hypothetical protein